MKKLHLNRKLFAIHSWLGLVLGIIYLLISVGGASIVFYPELNQLLYGDNIKIEKQEGKKLSYDEMYAIAKKEYPNSSFISLGYDPMHPENAPSISGEEPGKKSWFKYGGMYHSDYINPYSGKIIFRTDNTGTGNILGWLNDLHVSLQLGPAGGITVAFMSVAVLLSLITGLIFYRKSILKVFLFKVKIKFKNWRTGSSDLHRVIGTWALLFNLLIFGSGCYMYYTLLLPSGWKDMSKYVNDPPAKVIDPTLTVSLDSLVLKANQLIDEMEPSTIVVMRDTSEVINIYGMTKDKLFLASDNYASVSFKLNGELKEKSYKKWDDLTGMEKFDNLNFNLFHTGWAFGLIGKILWTVFGFAPAFLSLTGFLLWLRKRNSKNNVKLKIS